MRMQPEHTKLRSAPPPSFGDKTRRAIWNLAWTLLFRPSPILLHGWRRALLRLFGAKIGKGARAYPSARIWAPWNLDLGERSCLGPGVDCYSVAPIKLGRDSTVSQRAFLCSATRDISSPDLALLVGTIEIGAGGWVAAEAFVGPGVLVGDRAVVGARAVVMKDVPSGAVAVGNPARVVSSRVLAKRPVAQALEGVSEGTATTNTEEGAAADLRLRLQQSGVHGQ